ncbi:MAG: zinc ribbon domain-containing protein, partial [Planctomycetota bacterium]
NPLAARGPPLRLLRIKPMPLYEYHCRECDQAVEVLVRNAEECPLCPECGSGRLAKLLSVPAAHVGGSSDESPPGPCGSACSCFPQG